MVILIKINNNMLGFFLFYGIKYMYRIFVLIMIVKYMEIVKNLFS